MYTQNNLNSHASLLLSATPTIITSPLQNTNTNNPQTSSLLTNSATNTRRLTSTPLTAASNSDNDDRNTNTEPQASNTPHDDFINFKMPQNEIFEKLDGKIQKIVAAHSNLNKLYALNDFSSLGPGSKRPFELPPQLPPPPPCIPKVGPECSIAQWSAEAISRLDNPSPDLKSNVSSIDSKKNIEISSANFYRQDANKKALSVSIDSAISKLHQRRQQQTPNRVLNPQRQKSTTGQSSPGPNSRPLPGLTLTSLPSNSNSTSAITPAQFSLLTQKIKETLETECASKAQSGSLSAEDRKKFQEDLVALLQKEISSVTRAAKLKFASPLSTKPKTIENPSSLMKSSPQTLYNTIRRETSLLLGKREQTSVTNLSLLDDFGPQNRICSTPNQNLASTNRHPVRKLYHTMKVIVPPTENYQSHRGESVDTNVENQANKDLVSRKCPEKGAIKNQLSYQMIKRKLKLFQDENQIYLGISGKITGVNQIIKKKGSNKSLDKIVNRLQAKWSSPDIPSIEKPTFKQQIIYSSASLLQSSLNTPSVSAPTPIPVFRTPFSATSKGGYYFAGTSRIVKSKKSKRINHFGLKINNYLDSECPQPDNEKITQDQFAKCLNLVRSNDASLQRHQEHLLQSEMKWKLPIGNRPLRLRRIRGDGLHMPASASYKATRRVGLQ